MFPIKKNSTISWTLKEVKPWIPAMALLTACYIISAILSVWFSLGYREVIDSASGGDWTQFVRACIQQGILITAVLLDSILAQHLRDRLLAVMDRDMKKKMLDGLLKGEYAQISRYHTGDLLSLMNHDVQTLINTVLSFLPSAASMVTQLVAAVSVLIALEPRLTYVMLIGGVMVIVVTSIVRKSLKKLNIQASRAQGKVSGFIQETLEKLLMVQAMDISNIMERRADKLLDERYQIHRKRKNISLLTTTCMSLLALGSSFGALVFCSYGIFVGTMSFGTLSAISQLITQILSPLTNMSGFSSQYATLAAAAERLMETDKLCNTAPTERLDGHALYEQMTAISGQSLTFAYDRDKVFDGADFSIPKGTFGVIVGHSGIGKSTLLKLLLGVFRPAEGKLCVQTEQGSVELDRTTCRLFAYVPQGNLLLSGTLRDNLLVTNPDATPEQIARATYISAMDDYLPSLPDGLDTVVGENALGLSEGQAQRLSIARAILSDAPILLLDEATSALDDMTEKTVLSRIHDLPDKTCIAVTHRDAATKIADWSLEMHAGKCTLHFQS